ncbi:MAG: T9SS type A sorting domain-containing protein, partial [Candidatus Eisenbacteria sp.]|nr:T9SS type A sorting domain-containing protein [Candidatus Eisenbacteria bacterium]
DYAITNADQQVNRIDADGSYSVWYVLAAWWDPQEFCAVEFGLGNYNASIYPIDGYGPCYATVGLEIPTGDWPEPNTGIVVSDVGGGWSGNYLPVYFFGGYAYEGETKIPFTVNPAATPFAGFVTCEAPIPTMFPTTCLPIMGINVDGDSLCIPLAPPPPDSSVCCVGPNCYLLERESDCLIMQGTWHPGLHSCDPNPCVHVCCINQDCVLTFSQAECELMGGHYFPEWSSCDPNPCLPSGLLDNTRPTARFILGGNRPNPFKGETVIPFTLPIASRVELKIFNAAGQVVRTLVDDIRPAGYHQVSWHGRDAEGVSVCSGVYFAHLSTEGFSATRMMIVFE